MHKAREIEWVFFGFIGTHTEKKKMFMAE